MGEDVMHDWTQTQLWQQIRAQAGTEAERVAATLRNTMPRIQLVLAQGGSAPTDFTLHDSQHAFRVAQRMIQIVPQSCLEALSVYELALLLLSAYLHDIGMTPPQQLVFRLQQYLVDGASNALASHERADFMRWSDQSDLDAGTGHGSQNPMPTHAAQLLIAHYCRHKHVSLCDQWIEDNLAAVSLGSYTHWRPDLQLLCRSHHCGFDVLSGHGFDPKPVGGSGFIVHLRYLAAVLRVADILEFDPERTPDVIYRHRHISAGSRIYWFKDHHATLTIDHGQVTLTGLPPDAKIHRALDLMADEIETELRLVSRLDDELPFSHASFKTHGTQHKWLLSPNLRRIIRPLNDRYEYIHGAFRPNTTKMLQLLSGTRLYGNERVALRELLQNAFDAVRELTAIERLAHDPTSGHVLVEHLARVHEVKVDVVERDGRIWIVCSDDGVGMTKTIINEHLLVSGNSYRASQRELERKCHARGFALERTGQFGIGVLSYFMIADSVHCATRRSGLAGDSESTGWVFETEGIGDFGELRADTSLPTGTQVSLRLREDVVQKWLSVRADGGEVRDGAVDRTKSVADAVFDYIERTVFRSPCRLMLADNGVVRNTLGPGWTDAVGKMEVHWHERNDSDVEDGAEEGLVTAATKAIETARRANDDERNRQYEVSLRWELLEGKLPKDAGDYRAWIPFFELPEGASPAFASGCVAEDGVTLASKHNLYSRDEFSRPKTFVRMSWKGMRVAPIDEGRLRDDVWLDLARHGRIHIDWRSESVGQLSVSRESIVLADPALAAVDAISQHVAMFYRQCNERYSASRYRALWHLLSGKPDTSFDDGVLEPVPDEWLQVINGTVFLGGVRYPAIDLTDDSTRMEQDMAEASWCGKGLSGLKGIRLRTDVRVYGERGFVSSIRTFDGTWHRARRADRVVRVTRGGQPGLMPMYTSEVGLAAADRYQCAFPPEYAHIIGMRWNGQHLLNSCCAIVTAETDASRRWALETFSKQTDKEPNLDPRAHCDALLADNARCASWIVLLAGMADNRAVDELELWNALGEQHPDMLRRLYRNCTELKKVAFGAIDAYGFTSLVVLGEGSASRVSGVELEGELPLPQQLEWVIIIDS